MLDAHVQTLTLDRRDPRVGDTVQLQRDVLAETARPTSALPQTWRFVPAGTHGKLLGWRDRTHESPRAVVEVAGTPRRLVVFVGANHVSRVSRRAAAPS